MSWPHRRGYGIVIRLAQRNLGIRVGEGCVGGSSNQHEARCGRSPISLYDRPPMVEAPVDHNGGATGFHCGHIAWRGRRLRIGECRNLHRGALRRMIIEGIISIDRVVIGGRSAGFGPKKVVVGLTAQLKGLGELPRYSSYPVTPTLSVAAFHESDTCVSVNGVAVSPVGVDGAVWSGLIRVVTLVGDDCFDMFPAASKAATVYE